MSDPRFSTIGELLGGAPEHLVERSAEARAQAQGVPVEEVLAAWSGGGEIAVAAAPASEEPPAPAAPPSPPPAPAASAFPPAAVEVEQVAAAVVVQAAEEEEIEPVDPAPLADRIRLGARVGGRLGAALGLGSLAAAAPLLLGRLSQATAEGGPAVEVTWTSAAAFAAVWAVFGAVITMAARGAGRFRSPAYDTDASVFGSVLSGGFIGLVLGSGLGGVLFAAAEPTLTDTKLIPVGAVTAAGLLAVSALFGAVIGGLSQAMAQPAALSGAEAEDADAVKRRLSDAVLLPVASFAVIGVIVVSFGLLLLRYSGFAPWLAMLVAAGILAFAVMMSSRPNLRVTRGEFLTAAAGVGVVLLMLALIASSMADGGGGESEAPAEDHASAYDAGAGQG